MCLQKMDPSERMIICFEGRNDRRLLPPVEVFEQIGLLEPVSAVFLAEIEGRVAVLNYYVQLWQHMICLGCLTLLRRLNPGV
jgi:hypothetical protein